MIEKNSEVMSLLSVSNEKKLEEKDFLDCIEKEKKDKKNGHSEDITIGMFNMFPALYSKRMISAEKNTLSVTRSNRTAIPSIELYEIQQSRQKRNAILLPVSKTNENDVSLKDAASLSSSRLTSTETTVMNSPEKLIRSGDDEVREQNTETTKTHALSGQLKNDVMQPRQELSRQDIPPRRLQSSAAGNRSSTLTGAVIESSETQKKSLNLKYPFLRWAGEHSVKVSIPMDLNLSRHLSLIPSDSRAAEMLLRQASHLNGFTTELLDPEHNDEEPERRPGQHSKEEEQE